MSAANELARQLFEADQQGIRLASATLAAPKSIEEAFDVQRRTLAFSGGHSVGYKVAIRPDGRSISAPMFHLVRADESGTSGFSRPVVEGVEVEICFILGKDLAPAGDVPYTRETLLEHVSAIHSGVEFLCHRLDNGSASPALLFLADRLANAGYLLGEKLADPVIEPNQTYALSVAVNGEMVFTGPAKHPNNDPVAAFLLFANGLTETVAKGQVITTGSLCGAIPVTTPAVIDISGFTALTILVKSKRE